MCKVLNLFIYTQEVKNIPEKIISRRYSSRASPWKSCSFSFIAFHARASVQMIYFLLYFCLRVMYLLYRRWRCRVCFCQMIFSRDALAARCSTTSPDIFKSSWFMSYCVNFRKYFARKKFLYRVVVPTYANIINVRFSGNWNKEDVLIEFKMCVLLRFLPIIGFWFLYF